jgi:hypothetical protein
LILTTGEALAKVDFPAFDNAERPGWDGQVQAEAATPWIPAGLSGWEFGCNADVRQKANDDYKARVTSVPAEVRNNTTFVFVTPRNWPRTQPSKEAWVSAKQSEGKWKDVRVLDASNLEQWIEQSVPAQSWMAERLGRVTDGVLSLDECWDRWAKATRCELPKALFDSAVKDHSALLSAWLTQPPVQPFVISANSDEEALAFVACALDAVGTLGREFGNRAVVLQSVEALKKATTASSRFICVVASREVETALAGLPNKQHTIIIRGRNYVAGRTDIALDLVDDKTFTSALVAPGVPEEDVSRLARESGQSPTVLRRRLSNVPETSCPPWSKDPALAKKLVPMAFVGVWKSDTQADKDILSFLNESSYELVEGAAVDLSQCDQPPVWSIGSHRGFNVTIQELDQIAGHYETGSVWIDDAKVLSLDADGIRYEVKGSVDVTLVYGPKGDRAEINESFPY